ncbi:BMP family protein [Candidatus Chloroploca sp. Khr17]|uniref:BMP family protein n=1 Tax=Candidatus Chloroploca sp. Khr17 TaxID=2496869 RepID=UPI00101CDF9F|nr:BMP family protein [Candidatus Chloroploca sp. Khr17]
MFKRGTLVVVAFVLAVLLTACGGAPAAPAAPAATDAPVAAEPFKVAVVMPSTETDLAWSQAMIDALRSIQAEMGGEAAMQISISENMFNVTDAAAALRDYASAGNQLVIAHGTQYGTSMFEVARDFPEVSFAWGTATDTGEAEGFTNVFSYNASAEEGGYVNGVIAAMLSTSNVVGIVGPVEAGDAKAYIDGFEQGVLSVKPDSTVNKTYTGSFGDTAAAAEAASTHIAAGADVLTGSAQQVVGAIGVAKERGALWLGTQSSQASLAPDIVVATQLYDWTGVLKDIIAKIQAGTLGGTAYDLTLENGGLKIVFNSAFPGVTPEMQAAVDTAIQGISSGVITVLP